MSDCLFCKIVRKEILAQIVFEDDVVLAFMDIRPTNPGHVLVIPKEHSTDMLDTKPEVFAHMTLVAQALAPAVLEASNADGLNLIMNNKGAAGQIIFHAHMHIVPRLSDDGLRHWPGKEPKEGELKVMAERILHALNNNA